MYLPQVYTCSPSWTPLPPSSLYHPSGSSQCTSPNHPVSCIEPGLATRFVYDIIHVSMPFSQIIPPSPSPTESKRLFYTSVSLSNKFYKSLFIEGYSQLKHRKGKVGNLLMVDKIKCRLETVKRVRWTQKSLRKIWRQQDKC